MNYKGFELENVSTDTEREYLCYWDDELAGGADDWDGITELIDKMTAQGVHHESMLVETADEARDRAIDWQTAQQEQALSYGEFADYQAYFEELGEQFNLTEEFKENGII